MIPPITVFCYQCLAKKSFAILDSKKFQSWMNVPKLKSFLKILLSWIAKVLLSRIAKVLLSRIAKHAYCSAILDSKKANYFQSTINVPKLKSFLKNLLSWIAKVLLSRIAKVLLSRIAKIANCSAILDSKGFAILDCENCKVLLYIVLLSRISKISNYFAILDSKNCKLFCYPG